MTSYKNADESAIWKKLQDIAASKRNFNFAQELTAERVRTYVSAMASGLSYSYAAKQVDGEVLDLLQDFSDDMQLIARYKALLSGDKVNTGEDRRVLHHLLRGELVGPVIEAGRDLGKFYREQKEGFFAFAEKVHAGTLRGSKGHRFEQVVQIGIGGSDLGPRAIYLALENLALAQDTLKLRARFISNVDPDDAAQVLSEIALEKTLFVLVSKSGTTQETLANELFVKERLKEAGLDPACHMLAVTSETSPLAHNANYLDSFYIDDYIGGRYSSTSAVGGLVFALAFGGQWVQAFLSGAAEADKTALEGDIRKNPALLDALIGLWERNFLHYSTTAILPYSQALSRFPAHLQQLDMESNGKGVNYLGKKIAYKTGPIVFGEPGTNGQHSFYQLLHQGSDIVPLQFIGFRESQRGQDIEVDASTSQQKLVANLVAQIVAFAVGKDSEDGNKLFPGRRPSSLIVGDKLSPQSLGSLLAHFENKVMFQGFAWNINSFDQEGVQLGKLLTKQVLAGPPEDSALKAYAQLLGIS